MKVKEKENAEKNQEEIKQKKLEKSLRHLLFI